MNIDKDKMIEELKPVKLRHKIIRKIGLCPRVDLHNTRVVINFTFSNIKDYMENQSDFNEEIFAFMTELNDNTNNDLSRGMIQ